MSNQTLYINIIIGVIIFFVLRTSKTLKENKKKEYVVEGFLDFGAIGKALSGLADFFSNFPTLFMLLVDACISFFMNFVDIFIGLFSALEWIIMVPIWAIQLFIFLVALFFDLIVVAITWLHPVTMIKGIVKLILAVIKIILSFVFDTVIHLIRLGMSYFGNLFKAGLWGIPHGLTNMLI